MPTSTPNMGLSKPTEGGETGTWDTELNNSLDTVDAHDHTSGKGVQVPSAGININADLSFAGFELLDCSGLELQAVASADQNNTLYLNSADNELYWRDNAANTVQITNGGALDLTGVGGITGDYGAGTESVSYSDSTKIYNFLQNTAHRAKIDAGDIRLFEPVVSTTTAVTLKSPTSLAGSYDWIFPAALPAAARCLTIDASGNVDHPDNITIDGTLSVGGDVTITGEAASGLTLASNQNLVLQGTGEVKHGDRTKLVPLELFGQEGHSAGALALSNAPSGPMHIEITAPGIADLIYLNLDMKPGERVKQVDVYFDGPSTGAADFEVFRCSMTGFGAPTSPWSSGSSSGASQQTVTLTGTAFTVAEGENVSLEFVRNGAWTGTGAIWAVKVTYDRP